MNCKHKNMHAVAVPAPHWYKQVCSDCGCFIKWLGKSYSPSLTHKRSQVIADNIGQITTTDSLGRKRGIWHKP